MRYLDVCAGISASTVAWKPLGWQAAAYSEIEPAPRAILSHHYPDVPLHGDFTTIQGDEYGPIDLLVGGTPCQDFSVAGLRAGLDGERGNLSLEYLRLADRTRPRWLVWENVPGVLSQDGGRAFGAILGAMGELGYGFAYRVLDAQFFGVPQRRRRVFVVGYLGDWRRAAAVLFEQHSLSGHPAPRREARKGAPGRAARGVALRGREGGGIAELGDEIGNALRASSGGGDKAHVLAFGGNDTRGPIEVSTALNSHGGPHGRLDFESETFVATTLRARDLGRGVDSDCTDTLVAHALRGEGFDASEDGTGRGTPLVPVAFNSREDMCHSDRLFGSLGSSSPQAQAIAWGISSDAIERSGEGDGSAAQRSGLGIVENTSPTIRAHGRDGVATTSAVRRLTPRECERLQGFPDDYTLVPHRGKPMADGPRYKALGNSMAVPVMQWIGERIDRADGLRVNSLAA